MLVLLHFVSTRKQSVALEQTSMVGRKLVVSNGLLLINAWDDLDTIKNQPRRSHSSFR